MEDPKVRQLIFYLTFPRSYKLSIM